MATGTKKKGKRAGKRARLPQKTSKQDTRRPALRPASWPQVIGEAFLVLIILSVPLVLNTRSNNICDIKDVVLGLGAAAGLALWLLASLARGEISWARSRLNPVVVAFASWSLFSVIYSRYWYVSISEFGRLAGSLAVFWLAILCLRTLRQVRWLLAASAVVTIPVCVYAFLQASGRDFIHWTIPVERAFSFLGNATYLGGFVMLLIPVMVANGVSLLLRDEDSPARSGLWPTYAAAGFFFAIAAAMLVCLYLSRTLAGVIGLSLGSALAFVLVLIRGGVRAVRVAIPVAALVLLALLPVGYLGYSRLDDATRQRIQQVLHLQDPEALERSLHWRTAFGIFRERPLIGEGYGAFHIYSLEKMASEWYAQDAGRSSQMLVPGYAHNEYLQVLADLGAVGGLLFFGIVLGALGLSAWLAVRHPNRHWAILCLGVTAAMTAFLFQNFFGVTFRQSGVVMFFWLWLAVIVLAAASFVRSGEETPTPRLHQFRFRPVPVAGLVPAAVALIGVWMVLWSLATKPMYASMDLSRAKGLAGLGRYKEAAALADHAVSLCPYSFIGYYTSGFAWGQTGDLDKAVAANKKALELMPGNASVYYNLGVAYKEKGRLDEAAANFKRAVELMPTSYRHQAAMAETLAKQRKFAEAEQYAREAVRLSHLSGEEIGCLLLLADIYSREGKVKEMTEEMRQASLLSPNDLKLKERVTALLFNAGDYERGAAAAREWIRLDPNSAIAHNALGTYFFNKQNYPEAKSEFDRAVQLDPRNVVARFNLALTYGRLRNFEGSMAQLRQVAAQAPDSPQGQKAQELLDRLAKMSVARQPAASGARGGSAAPK